MKNKNKDRLTYGIIIDSLYSNYQQTILSGIIDLAQNENINTLCFVTGRLKAADYWEYNKNILFDFIGGNNVDGLIFISTTVLNIVGTEEFTNYIGRYKPVPIVSIGVELKNCHNILIKNEYSMTELFEHLYGLHQYRRIAFITGPKDNEESNKRLLCYKNFLKNYRIPYDPDLVLQGNFTSLSGKEAVRTLVDERKIQFDCIAAANDDMALGAIDEMTQRNMIVPIHEAVTGFDDIENSKRSSLTTVRQPLFDQGGKAAEVLLKLIKKENPEQNTYLNTELVIRESCGCRLDSINETFIWQDIAKKQSPEDFFNEELRVGINDIVNTLSPESYSIERGLFEKRLKDLLEAFIQSYKILKPEAFLNQFKYLTTLFIKDKIPISFLQKIISRLRKNLINCRFKEQEQVFMEDLIHSARIMLEEAHYKINAYQETLYLMQLNKMNAITGKLTQSFIREKLIDNIYDVLNDLGFKECYLSLFDNPEMPLEKSRLILAFNRDGRCSVKDNMLFETNSLIPPELFPEEKRFDFIIHALYHSNERLGFIVLNIKDFRQEAITYDDLCNKISSSLRVNILIKDIAGQAMHLEEEVIKRTSDLVKSNKKMNEEIKIRKKAEKNLKSANEKLDSYNKVLQYLSLKDGLTNLYNRRGFMILGEQHLKYARRYGKNFILMFGDLDGLKKINDRYGHTEGDNAIKAAAGILHKTMRTSDIIGRIGGDEFTVLIMDAKKEDILYLKTRIKEEFDNFNKNSKKPYTVAISFGYQYVSYKDPAGFEEILDQADKLLYLEKNKK